MIQYTYMGNIILLLYVAATSLALIFVKLGTASGLPIKIVDSKIHFNITFFSTVGIFLYGVSFLLYIYLISKNNLGYIIPVTAALVYTIIFLASYFIFHEVFTVTKIVGIVLIVGGLIFLNLPK
jgi:small multidrug resistance pump